MSCGNVCVTLCYVKDGWMGENTEWVPHLLLYVRFLWAKTFTVKQWRKEPQYFLYRWVAPLHSDLILSSSALPPSLSILCWGKIRITRECNEDYQINITDDLFFPCLLHGPSLHFPLLLESVTHSRSCSPWIICVFTLCSSSSLTASGYMWREKHLMNRRTWKERDGAVKRDPPPFRSDWVDSLWPASTHTEYFPLIIPFPLSCGSRRKGLTYFNDTESGLRDEESTLRYLSIFSSSERPERGRKVQNKQRCTHTGAKIHTSCVGLPPKYMQNVSKLCLQND